MKRASSQPQLKFRKPSNVVRGKAILDDHDVSDDLPKEQIQCLSLHQQELPKLVERTGWKKYGLWGQQKKNAELSRLEKQLKALENRINKQLRQFQAKYCQAMIPTRPKDVAQLLMPKSMPPLELTTLCWLGDWRPSAILGLLRSLIRSSPSLVLSLSYSGTMERAISQLIHDLRIEEAVIDEEMTEIQANCFLYLPFSPVKDLTSGPAFAHIQSELKKVHRIIVKAQNLRITALEMVFKKVLCQTDAAEFLVAFTGVQETVHQFSAGYKLRKGPVSVPLGPG